MSLEKFNELRARKSFDNDDELFALFDSLPPIGVDDILSRWQGGDFKSGHWAQEELVRTKWFGKWFKSPMDGVPLVSYNKDGKLASNLMMNGESSLWMIEFRGKVSATMVYDGVPIFDHFRKVNDNTLMGVMNGKNSKDGSPSIISNGRYYFFFLERIDKFPVEYVETPITPK